MKINKSFLSQIIKEEIKKVLYESHAPWEQKAVVFLTDLYQKILSGEADQKEKQFSLALKKLTGEDVSEVLSYLKFKVDHDMFRNVSAYLVNDKTSNLFSDYSDYQLPNSYQDTNPKNRDMDDIRNPYETKAASTIGRKPQPIEPQRQLDPRKKQKNLVHEEI
jgi:hypothetical protein